MIATTENAGGYSVVANLIKQTENGFEIPLSINRNESFYGQAIHDLIVKVDYETSERLHVKVTFTGVQSAMYKMLFTNKKDTHTDLRHRAKASASARFSTGSGSPSCAE